MTVWFQMNWNMIKFKKVDSILGHFLNQKTLNLWIIFGFFYRYLDDIDDEMDPEIEEAYEKFCLESERKRKQ
jgi:hypothetical protein